MLPPCLKPAMELPSFGTLLCGVFFPATPFPEASIHALRAKQGNQAFLRDSVPGARQEAPQSSALRLCRPPLRYAPSTPLIAPFQGWGTPPLALAAPAGVGQGQGVFVSKHSTAIQKRRNHPHEQHRYQQQPFNPSLYPQSADGYSILMFFRAHRMLSTLCSKENSGVCTPMTTRP